MDKLQIVKDMLQYSGYCADHNCEDCFGCREREFAKDLAENGYDNIEQVRKDTIKQLLLELAYEYDDWGEKRFKDYDAFKQFAKKYGVEV